MPLRTCMRVLTNLVDEGRDWPLQHQHTAGQIVPFRATKTLAAVGLKLYYY